MAATHVLRMKHLFYSIPNSALKTLRSTRGAIGCEQGNGSTRFKTGRGKIVPNNIGSTSTERHKKFHIPTVGGLDHSILTTNNTSGLGDGNVVQSFTLPDGRVAINRNPRNRQLDGTIHRTKGFQTNATVPNFFHRLRLRITGKYAYAEVDKPDGTLVLVCSTYEWAVIRHLYGGNDVCACENLGRLMAKRLSECGLTSIYWDRTGHKYHGKYKAFIDAVRDGGITLSESVSAAQT